MSAPRKYGDELRERATRMAVELRQDPATKAGAIKRARNGGVRRYRAAWARAARVGQRPVGR